MLGDNVLDFVPITVFCALNWYFILSKKGGKGAYLSPLPAPAKVGVLYTGYDLF